MASTAKYYAVRRAALVECLGGECFICGKTENLEFHHAEERDQGSSHGIGGWQQLYKLEKQIADDHVIQLLCPTCHAKVHGKVRQ